MQFIPKNIASSDIYYTNKLPVIHQKHVFPFAPAKITVVPGAYIIDQEITLKGCRMSSHGFIVESNALLVQPTVDQDISTLHCMMKGSASCQLEGVGKVVLYPGQFNIFQVGINNHRASFAQGYHESWHADYDEQFLQQLAPNSPLIRKLLHAAHQGSSAQVMARPGLLFPGMYSVINELRNINNPSPITRERMFLQLGVLLTQALEEKEQQQALGAMTPARHLFLTIKNYIDSNLDQDLSQEQLAKNFCISVSALKARFKEFFSISIGAYVRKQRLFEAKYLIDTTILTIEEVAYRVGYGHTQNFSRVYKEAYGHPPVRDKVIR